MRPLLLLALLLPQQPNPDGVKALTEAINRGDDKAADKALASIAASDNDSAVSGLARAYTDCLKLIAEAAKDEQRAVKELEDKKVVYNERGEYIRGNAMDEWKAKEALQKARYRVALADDFAPRTATALASLRSESAVNALLAKAKSAPDWYFRAHAVTALALAPAAKAALVEQLGKETEPGVKVALMDALRPHVAKEPGLLDRYLANVKDPYWQVQISALQGARGLAPKAAVPMFIAGMKNAGGRLRWEFNEALKSATGIDKHVYEAWQAWWDKHGEDFLAGTWKPGASEKADGPGRSTFYGMNINSSALILILDVSASMLQPPGWRPPEAAGIPQGDTSTRIAVAKTELVRCLERIEAGSRLNVILFHNFLNLYDPKQLVTMDEDRRKKMLQWVDTIAVDSGTSTWDALVRAFEFAGGRWNDKLSSGSIDSIYLMTDGEPTGRVVARKLFTEKVRELNRFKKVAIHTIGVDPGNGELLLKDISAQNDGTYVRR